MRRFYVAGFLAIGGLAVGCGSSTGSDGGATVDQTMGTDDMPLTGGDMAMGSDAGDGSVTTTPDMTAPPSGVVVFTEIEGRVLVAGNPTPVKLLAPSISLHGTETHDYDDNQLIGGCSADHFVIPSKIPADDLDAGKVTFSGYTGGKFLDQTMAPKEINCALMGGTYLCGYGSIPDGGVTVTAAESPYPDSEEPLHTNDMIHIVAAGGPTYGAFEAMVKAVGPVTPGTSGSPLDLDTITLDPAQDFSLAYTCSDGMNGSCGANIIAVTMTASDQAPADYGKGPTAKFGSLTCSTLSGGSPVNVKKGAIAAMLGCDSMGMNCDSTLKSLRTTVVRLGIPTTVNNVKMAAGHGEFGTAALK